MEESELARCQARIAALEKLPALPGAPALDGRRPEFLGRARGEPMVFVREPLPTPDEALPAAWLGSRKLFEKASPAANRVAQLRRRHLREPEALRALVLREGYAYAPDPLDALGIARGAIDTVVELAETEASTLSTSLLRDRSAVALVDEPAGWRVADSGFGSPAATRLEGMAGARAAVRALHTALVRALAHRAGREDA